MILKRRFSAYSKFPLSSRLSFFFNDTATTEIYTLSLHDALPISTRRAAGCRVSAIRCTGRSTRGRSEEHTSELQSQSNLVCRLLLEKKNFIENNTIPSKLSQQTQYLLSV